MTNEKMAALGMEGIGPEFSVSCADHGGSGQAIVQQWDANEKMWKPLTDYIDSDREVIATLVAEDSAAFAAENNISERCN